MNGFDLPLRQGFLLVLLEQIFHKDNRLPMVDGLKMLAHALAADGDAFQHHLGLIQTKGIALYGIRMISPAQHQILPQTGHGLHWQRPLPV